MISSRNVTFIVIGVVAAFITLNVVSSSPEPVHTPSATISIAEGSFLQGCEAEGICYIPHDLTVRKGATITWSNDDTELHTVTSGASSETAAAEFDSGIIEVGGSFGHTFESAGTYEYHCSIHPWAKAVVVVR
ncbi:MAG: hypothetical protein J4F28_00270 [Nitrosopumilaceae archaeon]|nr:hypothetical protein [Nitrosopumilaceae archaeon]